MILNLEQNARTIMEVLNKQIPQISREVLQISRCCYSLFHGNVVKNNPADKEMCYEWTEGSLLCHT